MRDFIANIEVYIMNSYIKRYVIKLIEFLIKNSDKLNKNGSIPLTPKEFFQSEIYFHIGILNFDTDIDKKI